MGRVPVGGYWTNVKESATADENEADANPYRVTLTASRLWVSHNA